MNTAKRLRALLLPVSIVAAAGIAAFLLLRAKPEAGKRPPKEMTMLVEFLTAQPTTEAARVTAYGVVESTQASTPAVEVSGVAVWINPNVVPGGRVREGEPLLRIDPSAYEDAVAQREAAVEQARLAFVEEQARQTVAAEEWRRLAGEDLATSAIGRSLALREPQARQKAAALAAAESALAHARLQLERTTLKAPFDAQVLDEDVGLGEWMTQQAQPIRLAGSSRYRVRASVPASEWSWFKHPDAEGQGGASAEITLVNGNERSGRWTGQVTRVLGDLEPEGRMARVLVDVDRPADGPEADGPALLLGSYVQVDITGRMLRDVFDLPALALHEQDRLWLANGENRLEMRAVRVAWRQGDRIIVNEGLAPGERVVTSRIPLPIPGMRLDPRPAATP